MYSEENSGKQSHPLPQNCHRRQEREDGIKVDIIRLNVSSQFLTMHYKPGAMPLRNALARPSRLIIS